MTRDKARAKCIKVMVTAMRAADHFGIPDTFFPPLAAAAFDSLHGIAVVNLPEATEEMTEAAYGEGEKKSYFRNAAIKSVFRAMSAAGDLTNAPEPKP